LYLGERGRVDLVLGRELKTNGRVGLCVPGGASTSLDGRVDLLVVGGAEDAEGVGGSDGGVVHWGGVADGSGVLGDGSLLHVVSNLTTDEETLVAEDGIGNGANSTASLKVGKDTAVEVVLLEVEVGLLALVASVGVEVGEELGLQARGDGVVQLDLGGQEVGRVPRLSDADACPASRQQLYIEARYGGAPWGFGVVEYMRSYISSITDGDRNGDIDAITRESSTIGERLLALEL
jgi:hypothetical protein